MQIIFNIIFSYLIGSISGSMVFGKLYGIDIRTMGSGNAGGTNAFRSVGPIFALGVVIIDILKGIIAVLFISKLKFYNTISLEISEYLQIICGIAAVLGHVYPIYYKFKGGKGAGTLIGIIGILFPASIGYALLSWFIVLIFTGFVGLGTIIASIVLVITTFYMYPGGLQTPFGIFALLMCIFIIFTHRSNIYRMVRGKENQFHKIMIFKKYFN
tara:strand:- start:1091 stop:1732 length:642 start_codon:yes stop_codon:yes gene_type:complete